MNRTDTATALKVSATTKTGALAGAIAGVMREKGEVDLCCVGPLAISRAVRATVLAGRFLSTGENDDGLDIYLVPAFIDIADRDSGEARSAVRLMVRAFADEGND